MTELLRRPRFKRRVFECTFFVILLTTIVAFGTTKLIAQQSTETIEELREVESKVQEVAEANMNACVSVTDGIGAGSGVIVTEGGLVLTAGHVMVGQGEYTILFPDGRTAKAKPLGKNLDIDAGMVQILDPGPWPHVTVSYTHLTLPTIYSV